MAEVDFRRRVRWSMPAPDSAGGWYAAAVAVGAAGIVTLTGARSEPMFWSGWILVSAGTLGAVVVRRATRRRPANDSAGPAQGQAGVRPDAW